MLTLGEYQLEVVQKFNYLGSCISARGIEYEITNRTAKARGAFSNLRRLWWLRDITVILKGRMYSAAFADTPSEATFTHSLLHQEHCTPSSSAHQHSHHSSSVEALPVSSVGSFSSNRPHHSLTVDNRRVSFSIPGQTELSGIGTSSQSRESDNSVYLSGISRSESVPGPSTSHTKTRKATSNTSSLHVLTSPPPTEHREKRTVSKKHRPNSPQESFVNYNVASDFGALSEILTSSGPGTSVAKKRRRDRQNPLSRSPGISCLCLTDKESFLCPAPFSIDLTLRSAHIAPVVSDSGTTFAGSMLSGGVGSNSSKTQSQACTVSSTHHDLRPRHHNVPCVPTPCSLPCGVRQTPSVTAELPHPAQSELMPQRHVFTAPGDVPCARVPSEHVSTAALHHSQQPCTSTDRKRCTGHSAHPLASCSLNPSVPITLADPFSYVPPNSVDLSYLPTPENGEYTLTLNSSALNYSDELF
ncbi:unnamed protein product [Dicrocoelium dendriticum]|nr:unnamed protein product [Dicrocoelium dendriticum]